MEKNQSLLSLHLLWGFKVQGFAKTDKVKMGEIAKWIVGE
jgi:hypothetical protein